MRFLMMIKGDKDYEAGKPPSPRLMKAIGQVSANLAKSGTLRSSEGLLPSSKGARVRAARAGS